MTETRLPEGGAHPLSRRALGAAIAFALAIVCSLWLLGLYARTQGSSVVVERDIEYAKVEAQALRLDLYRPAEQKERLPAVILIHGGGWRMGTKDDLGELAQELARAGLVAVCIEYRLTAPGKNTFPAQLDDVQRAVRWVRAHAGELRVRGDRIGAMGQSAGGHLAALLGTLDTRDNSDAALAEHPSRVQAVVSVSGPMLFGDGSMPAVSPEAKDLVANLFGATPFQAPELYRLGSPAANVDARTSPFLLIHGTDDELVPFMQSLLMARALDAAGREVKVLPLHGEKHSFQRRASYETWGRESVDFLARHLADSPPAATRQGE